MSTVAVTTNVHYRCCSAGAPNRIPGGVCDTPSAAE